MATNAATDKKINRVTWTDINADLKHKRSEMVEEASRLFGYRRTTRGNLAAVLQKLEINPLNAADVAKYKKSHESTRDRMGPNGGTQTVSIKWKTEMLGNYEGIVPEAILSKAVAIKKALPAVEFEVEHLVERRGYKTTRYPDPFLVAVLPGLKRERIFIDVWDEPDFEKKLYA